MGKYWWGVGAMALWGAAPVALKSLVAQLPGPWLMMVVYSIAACVTLPWLLAALWRRDTSPAMWLAVIVVGILLTSCFNLLAAIAAPAVTGTTIGAIVALEPLMVAAIAALAGRQWLRWQTCAALAISLAGAWMLVATPAAPAQAGHNALWAVGLVVLGALLWSAAVVFAGRLRTGWGPLQGSMVLICCGSLPFLLMAPFYERFMGPWPAPSMSGYGGIAFMAIGATVAANLLWLRSLRELGALANSLLINLGPLVTFILAATLLGEAWGVWQSAGAALIMLGLTWGACNRHAPGGALNAA